jgi:hypothetical protein
MSLDPGHVEAGSWPDWLVAVLALAALLVSASTLAYQLSDRRRQDARRVDSYLHEGLEVRVANGAARPVFDVGVRLQVSGAEWRLVDSRRWRIGPGDVGAYRLQQAIQDAESLGPSLVAIETSFRDASGRAWRRTADGRLRRKWRRR